MQESKADSHTVLDYDPWGIPKINPTKLPKYKRRPYSNRGGRAHFSDLEPVKATIVNVILRPYTRWKKRVWRRLKGGDPSSPPPPLADLPPHSPQ